MPANLDPLHVARWVTTSQPLALCIRLSSHKFGVHQLTPNRGEQPIPVFRKVGSAFSRSRT